MAMAPAPSSAGKPSAPVSTSKCAYRSRPGVSRPCAVDLSGRSPSPRKVRLIRHRRHSPFGPHWVSGRSQVAQIPAVSLCAFAVPRPTLMSFIQKGHVRPSVFGTDGAVLHQYPPDRRPCRPLRPLTSHGIAGEDAKATYAASQLALRVGLRLPPG